MKEHLTEKVYIGKVEALEICLERDIMGLPKKGFETITSLPLASNPSGINPVIGCDDKGFYLCEISFS